jgi:CBS domain-containing protein
MPLLKRILAKDIMTTDVVVVKHNQTIGEVAQKLLKNRVSGYPVLDDGGSVVGIVTLSDFFHLLNGLVKEVEAALLDVKDIDRKLEHQIDIYKNRPISEIMSSVVVSISPITRLTDILDAVVHSNIYTFPVMQDGELVGIVGRHDILNAAFVYG